MADDAANNLRAFLQVIRWAEFYPNGNQPDDYYRMYGGDKFTDSSDHPRKAVTKWHKTSTAAGAYMILEDTWNRYDKLLNLPDFGPASQDKVAIEIIRQSHALELVRAGKIEEAIAKLRSQWTSLPGAKQSRVTMKQALDEFKKNRDWADVVEQGQEAIKRAQEKYPGRSPADLWYHGQY